MRWANLTDMQGKQFSDHMTQNFMSMKINNILWLSSKWGCVL